MKELLKPVRKGCSYNLLQYGSMLIIAAIVVWVELAKPGFGLECAILLVIAYVNVSQIATLNAAIRYWRDGTSKDPGQLRLLKLHIRYESELVNVAGWVFGVFAVLVYSAMVTLAKQHDISPEAKNTVSLMLAILALMVAVAGGARKLLIAKADLDEARRATAPAASAAAGLTSAGTPTP